MRRLRLGMAQINTTVGDFKGNTAKILEAIAEGKSRGVDILTPKKISFHNLKIFALFGLVFAYLEAGHQIHPYMPFSFQTRIFLI
jgi:hypothetical protein